MNSDLRSPLNRARGLGSAKSGVHHFWMQRLTAVALGVVLAAAHYPGTPRTGDAIFQGPGQSTEAKVFHAGTVARDGQVLTSGGRVLCATALGDSVRLAQSKAYELIKSVNFDGMQYRTDIGYRAISR